MFQCDCEVNNCSQNIEKMSIFIVESSPVQFFLHQSLDESSFKIESTSIMKGSRRVLVKVLLFQLDGRGHPHIDAMPSFFPDSKNSLVGLSNEVSLVSEMFWKVVERVY